MLPFLQLVGLAQAAGAMGNPQQQQQQQAPLQPVPMGNELPPLDQAPIGNDEYALLPPKPPLNQPTGGDGSNFNQGNQYFGAPMGDNGMALPEPENYGPTGVTSQQGSMPGSSLLQMQQQDLYSPIQPVQSYQPNNFVPPQQTTQQQQGQSQKANWANLINPIGTAMNPNMFTRLGVGYNQGGLMGSLGALLTDFSPEQNELKKRQQQTNY